MAEKAVSGGLTDLRLQGFRHLKATTLTFSPGLNVVHGANAAGKSSLLEAIYFLARAKSFLTPRLQRLIANEESLVVVSGRIQTVEGLHRLGVSFSDAKTRVRLNGEDVRSLSTFARLIPIQVLNTEAQRLLTEGPGERRSFLNWGVFHVEHTYRDLWRRYQRGLRQRNAALKMGDAALATAWEEELAMAGESVTAARVTFLQDLLVDWQAILRDWMPDLAFSWRYRCGWTREETLLTAMTKGRDVELKQGFTLYGPHRADLHLTVAGYPVAQRLSRGQQKVIVIALRLALLQRWQASSVSRPILLLDDLAAELDEGHRRQVMERVNAMDVQTFVTTIETDRVPYTDSAAWFHVEQGRITSEERDQPSGA